MMGQAFFLAGGVVFLGRPELSAPEPKGVSLSILVHPKEHSSDLMIARIRVYGVPQALARQSKTGGDTRAFFNGPKAANWPSLS